VTPLLLFDLDDTLVAEVPAATAAYRATAEHAAARVDVDADRLARDVRTRARALWNATPVHPYCLRLGISSSEAMWCRFAGGGEEIAWLRAWAPEYRRTAWRDALAQQGIDDADLAAELAERFPAERRAYHEVFEDVVPALDELGRRHRLALITNGASCLQREKLDASGLAGRFDAVVVSGDSGAGKPDPAIFRLALDRLGGEAAGAWMIGDSLERDVRGALGAGLRAVWVNRFGDDGDHEPQVTTLAELPALLARG
jgi:putative hydrolase of the HAD superfamily